MRFRNNKNRHHSMAPAGVILENSTDLTLLSGKKVLMLLDEQNLSITARKLGYLLQYDKLAQQARRLAAKVQLHLFTDTHACDRQVQQRFEKEGYRVHLKETRCFRSSQGDYRQDSNVDNLFAFWAGIFTANTNCEVVVLGSGDYGLAGELAQAIQQRRKRRPLTIMTLSLPGSTARDLDARRNANITANLEIGCDVMQPIPCRKQSSYPVFPDSFRNVRLGQSL